jgi:hypothetical protein
MLATLRLRLSFPRQIARPIKERPNTIAQHST